MGGKSKKKAPAAPDYTKLAQEQARLQTQMVQQQTVANRPDQVTALGSLKWSQDPTTGKWTQTETLSPAAQAALDRSLALQASQIDQITNLMGNQGTFSGGPAMPTYTAPDLQFRPYKEYEGMRIGGPSFNEASGDEYGRKYAETLLARVRPQQQIEQESMATKLRLQGLQPGTEAYDRAYRNLLTSQGDVTSQAQLQGQLAGTQQARENYLAQLQGTQMAIQAAAQQRADYETNLAAQQQEFMQKLGGAQFGLSQYGQQLGAQQQGYQQALQQYLLPWQTASMAQGLASNVQMPQFQGFSQAGSGVAPEILNAAQQQYAQQMQQYNEQQQRRQGKGQGLGTLVGGVAGSFFGMPTAGAAIGGAAGGGLFSDMALKEDAAEMSDQECYDLMKEMVPISWRWTGTSVRDSGLSAQDVLEKAPMLVNRAERGLLKVNYSKFCAILLGAFRHLAKKEEENGSAA